MHDFDAIVSDIRLVDWQDENVQGLQALSAVPEERRPATVVVTAFPNEDNVRLAFKDYKVMEVLKKSDFRRRTFIKVLESAVKETHERRRPRSSG